MEPTNKWLSVTLVAALSLFLGGWFSSAQAGIPQSDDFKGTQLKTFWKFKNIGTEAPTEVKVQDGKLIITGSGADVWMGTYSWTVLYQENISGNFSMRVKVNRIGDCSPWSAAGVFIAQNDQEANSAANPDGTPVHFLIHVTRDNGTEMKGGSLNQSRGNGFAAGRTPPYWVRLDTFGDGTVRFVRGFTSLDGQSWELVRTDVIPGREDEPPMKEPFIAGIHTQVHCGEDTRENEFESFIVEPLPIATVTGTVKDAAGKAVARATVSALNTATGEITSLNTAEDGTYKLFLSPGDYLIVAESVDAVPQSLTGLKDGDKKTLDFQGTVLPTLDLATAQGGTWKLFKGGTLQDFSFADPKFKETAEWIDVTAPENVQNETGEWTYFWYRSTFTIPADWQKFNRPLLVDRYNIDDHDWSFFNGKFLGSQIWNAGGTRTYAIPRDVVKFGGDNVLAIKGWNGPGGAGFTAQAPLIRFGSPLVGTVIARLVTPDGKQPQGNTTFEIKGKILTRRATAQEYGGVSFGNLPPGEYTLSVVDLAFDADPISQPSQTVKVEGGQVIEAGFSTGVVEKIEVLSLRAADLKSAGKPGWRFLGTTPDDREKIRQNINEYAKPDYPDKGADKIVPTATWLEDWELVPGDAGPAGRSGEPGGIPDNSNWVQRLHIVIPKEWEQATAFSLQDFNIDDNNLGTFWNGVKIGEGSGWLINWKFKIPKEIIKFGQENVLTIVGNEGGGGAGHNLDYGGPRILAAFGKVAPPPVVPAAVCGDANGDGRVAINDAILALQIAVGTRKATDAQIAALDLNGDGKVAIAEVILVLRKAVNPAFALTGKNCK